MKNVQKKIRQIDLKFNFTSFFDPSDFNFTKFLLFHIYRLLLEDEVDLDLELSSLEFSELDDEPEPEASCLRLIFLRSKSNAVGFFRFKFGGLFNGRLGSRATSVILTIEISSSESGTSP